MRDCKLELVLALLAVLTLPAVASAQGFVADRSTLEGPGFKTGRLVLHPGLSVEGGYDSNVFLQNEEAEDSFILRVTGYLDVATEPPQRQREGDANLAEPQKITFRGGIGTSFYQYFDGRVASNAAADARVDFAYNPSKVFSLQVRDKFKRTIRPFTNPNTPQGTTTSYGRNINFASLDLVGRSKSQVLEGRLGYTNVIEFFDSNVFQYGNNLTHRVPASLSWSFFPTSALIYDLVYINQQYDQNEVASSPTLLSDNNRVRTTIGYNGALTDRFSLTVLVGYTVGFYSLASDFDGVVARVDARWQPRPTITLVGGYDRDFRPSFIGNYTEANRLYLNLDFVLSGAIRLGLKGWVSFDRSGLALDPQGGFLGNEPNRKDIRAFVGLFGEYRFTAWLALFGEVGWLADFTDFQYLGTQPLIDPRAGYQRFDAWLGLRVFY